MISAEQILELAMKDPIAASELISTLADPVVGLTKELINKYASEFGDQIKAFNAFVVQGDIDAMNQYVTAGFSRAEALELLTVRKQAMISAINSKQK